MKAEMAELEDFLYCLDTNPWDKTHFLAVHNLHFLHRPLGQHSMQYCYTAGMSVESPGGTHHSSWNNHRGSNVTEGMATVQPLKTSLNTLLSVCYWKMTRMLSAEMEMQTD